MNRWFHGNACQISNHVVLNRKFKRLTNMAQEIFLVLKEFAFRVVIQIKFTISFRIGSALIRSKDK